jgi:hypothetical protein
MKFKIVLANQNALFYLIKFLIGSQDSLQLFPIGKTVKLAEVNFFMLYNMHHAVRYINCVSRVKKRARHEF